MKSKMSNNSKLSDDDRDKMINVGCQNGSNRVNDCMKEYVLYEPSDDKFVINLDKTWENILLAAHKIVEVRKNFENKVIAVSMQPIGYIAVSKFADYVGVSDFKGPFNEGTFFNSDDCNRPRIVIATDPKRDAMHIREAFLCNATIIAFCNTNSPLEYVHLVIPCNNNSPSSISLMWWLLTREVLRLRGEIIENTQWDNYPLYFTYKYLPAQAQVELSSNNDFIPEYNNDWIFWHSNVSDSDVSLEDMNDDFISTLVPEDDSPGDSFTEELDCNFDELDSDFQLNDSKNLDHKPTTYQLNSNINYDIEESSDWFSETCSEPDSNLPSDVELKYNKNLGNKPTTYQLNSNVNYDIEESSGCFSETCSEPDSNLPSDVELNNNKNLGNKLTTNQLNSNVDCDIEQTSDILENPKYNYDIIFGKICKYCPPSTKKYKEYHNKYLNWLPESSENKILKCVSPRFNHDKRLDRRDLCLDCRYAKIFLQEIKAKLSLEPSANFKNNKILYDYFQELYRKFNLGTPSVFKTVVILYYIVQLMNEEFGSDPNPNSNYNKSLRNSTWLVNQDLDARANPDSNKHLYHYASQSYRFNQSTSILDTNLQYPHISNFRELLNKPTTSGDSDYSAIRNSVSCQYRDVNNSSQSFNIPKYPPKSFSNFSESVQLSGATQVSELPQIAVIATCTSSDESLSTVTQYSETSHFPSDNKNDTLSQSSSNSALDSFPKSSLGKNNVRHSQPTSKSPHDVVPKKRPVKKNSKSEKRQISRNKKKR